MTSSCSAPSPSYELYKLFRHNDSSLTAGYAVGGVASGARACKERVRKQRDPAWRSLV